MWLLTAGSFCVRAFPYESIASPYGTPLPLGYKNCFWGYHNLKTLLLLGRPTVWGNIENPSLSKRQVIQIPTRSLPGHLGRERVLLYKTSYSSVFFSIMSAFRRITASPRQA